MSRSPICHVVKGAGVSRVVGPSRHLSPRERGAEVMPFLTGEHVGPGMLGADSCPTDMSSIVLTFLPVVAS